jgi:hypothetical protein
LRNLLGDLGGGGAGVQDHGLAVFDERCGDLRDAHLLGVMQRLLDGEGPVVVIRRSSAPPCVRSSAPAASSVARSVRIVTARWRSGSPRLPR